MAASFPVVEMSAMLRACTVFDSKTVQRMCEAFKLIDNLSVFPEKVCGSFLLAQRVTVLSVPVPGCEGSLKSFSKGSCSYSVVFDNGTIESDILEENIIPLSHIEDARLDYVSRMVWMHALSENRLPVSGAQVKSEWCAWEQFEMAFQVTTPWSEESFTSRPHLMMTDFVTWLYLFAEAMRMKISGQLMRCLGLMEECLKQINMIEIEYNANPENNACISDIANFVRYCPSAVDALGTLPMANGSNGAFSIARHMLATQMTKVLRAIHRQPKQENVLGETVTVDESLLVKRLWFYMSVLRVSESELRAKGCEGVFGDGQGDWLLAWLCSLKTDTVGVCAALRRAIAVSDNGNVNDFVAAKARYDLIGYIHLGGEGHSYDMRDLQRFSAELQTPLKNLGQIEMSFFVDGESFCSKMAKSIVTSDPSPQTSYSRQAHMLPTAQEDWGLNICFFCLQAAEKLSHCAKCKKVVYCSRECQKAHFPRHKKLCKASA